MKRPILFEVVARPTSPRLRGARAGILKTPHGEIKTPAFIGVATKATLKGIAPEKFADIGVQGLIANTYHLYLSPSEKLIAQAGGIHRFMNYDGPIMTDSGGFQVFSLGAGFGKKVSKFSAEALPREEGIALYDEDLATSHGKLAIVDDEGVTFTSHLDGSLHRFTPERSVEIQHGLGADIIYAFDQCTAPDESYEFQKEAMERTHRWAKRSLAAHRQDPAKDMSQGIYGVAQGGQFDDLRRESARYIGEMGFDGFGLGGSFSKKYGEHSLESALAMLKELPPEMPVHGLGVGEPEDILLGAEYGVDTFDCVTPTRKGRTGCVYTHAGQIIIRNTEFKDDFSPVDSQCGCFVCTGFTRAYIHHLFRAGEMLGPILAASHNVYFLTKLTANIRQSIIDDTFEEYKSTFLSHYQKEKAA